MMMTKTGMIISGMLVNFNKRIEDDVFIDIKTGQFFITVKITAASENYPTITDRKEFIYWVRK